VLLDRLMGLHPKLIDLSLDRLNRVLEALGRPHEHLPPVVHVAGTNGKGSLVAYMRSALIAAGYHVHVYTSPHLVRFHERIQVDGEIIAEADLAALLDECERANGGEPITFFEITTAAAFLAFSRRPADILVMETGLGGRLDATNVIDRPLLTAITPVSLDHQHFLGDTLPEIAGEKAGIIKRHVPVVIGPQEPDALAVLEARAAELDAPAVVWGRDFCAAADADGFDYRDGQTAWRLPLPSLYGAHQIANAATAVACLRRLEGFTIGRDAIAEGLSHTVWPARMQRLTAGTLVDLAGNGVEIWVDGGHNPSAGEILADACRGWDDRPIDLIVGMMNTKDPRGFAQPLAPYVRRAICLSIPGEKNTLPGEAAAQVLASVGIDASVGSGIDKAVASLAAGAPSRILICGSLYLAGRVLAANQRDWTPVT
jgi:dihydrofolate synthase / folylpolyglutamate synthase